MTVLLNWIIENYNVDLHNYSAAIIKRQYMKIW